MYVCDLFCKNSICLSIISLQSTRNLRSYDCARNHVDYGEYYTKNSVSRLTILLVPETMKIMANITPKIESHDWLVPETMETMANITPKTESHNWPYSYARNYKDYGEYYTKNRAS